MKRRRQRKKAGCKATRQKLMSKVLRKHKKTGEKCLRRGHMENVAYKGRRKKAAGKSRRKRHDQNIK